MLHAFSKIYRIKVKIIRNKKIYYRNLNNFHYISHLKPLPGKELNMDEADLSDIEQENRIKSYLNKIKLELNKKEYSNEPKECEDCGNFISEKRLKAMPSAIRCLACQEKYERNK